MTFWQGVILAILVPVSVGVLWIIRKIEQYGIELFGPNGTNGLRGDVKELKRWRDDLRADLPKMFETERHKMRNLMHAETGELDLRIRDLEKGR